MKLQISLYFCYCLLTACVVLHRNNIPKQQADDYKKSILAISNDLFQKGVHVHGGYTIPYRLLSPERLGFSRRYPLVLVLHSSGTPQGTDNKSQLGVLAKLWAQPAIRENYLAYVLAPQFPVRSSNYGPIQTNDILTSAADPRLATVLHLVDSLKHVLPIDPRKIYVIGFSMGASTAINAMGQRPDLFAAAVSISGIPEFDQLDVIALKPIWFIHGDADTENPIASDALFYKKLQEQKARNIRYWQVEGLQHEIYPELYMTDEIPKWLWRN